jgi:hypothetical protein
VEKALTTTSEGVLEILAEATVRDEVASLLDRLDDVYSDHETVHHVHFWRGVTEYLRRTKTFSATEFGQLASIVDNVGDILPRAVKRRPGLKGAARDVFHDLAERGDLTLVPNWLREQMWAHGLFDLRARGGETWYTYKEALLWCDRLSKAWKQRLLQENLVKQAWDLHWAYAMLQSKNWDDDCRNRLTALLFDDETFDNLILMMFGGAYVTGKTAIAELCDPTTFWSRVDQRLESDGVAPEVRQALEKSKARDFD